MKHVLTCIGLCSLLSLSAQDWEKMGTGFRYPNNLVWTVEEHRNELFVVGTMLLDGDSNDVRGLAKWDGENFIQYAGPMPLNPRTTCLFRYQDSLFIGTALSWDEKYWLAYYDEVNHKLDTVYDKTLYGPIFSSLQRNDTLYVSGIFNQCGPDSTWGFCMYDGTTWKSLFDRQRVWGDVDNFYNFTWYKGKLYVGGEYYFPDIGVEDIAILENGEVYQFGGGINFTFQGFVSDMVVYKDELYIGGYFVSANGMPVSHIVRWDGTEFKDVGGGADYNITEMLVYGDNLYACGLFTTIGGIYSPGIARWDGQQWHRFTEDVFFPEASIGHMQVYKDELYISGNFLTINGDTFRCVAKYKHQLPGEQNQLEVWLNNYQNEIIINVEDSSVYDIRMDLYDLSGRKIKHYSIENYTGYLYQAIPVSELSAGIYIADVRAGEKRTVRKLLKCQ